MNNLEKIKEMFTDNSELEQKTLAEAKRLVESKEAGDEKEAITKAVKAVLDIDLTEEELDAMAADSEKINDEELDEVAGGGSYIHLRELNDRFKCKHPKRVKTGNEKERSFLIFWSRHEFEYTCPDCGKTFWA